MEVFNNVESIDFSSSEKDNTCRSERYHKEAIYRFEKKLRKQPNCVNTLCDWIASYHDLASIYAQKGKIESAQKCLLIPHQSMLYMAREHHGDIELEQIALRSISLTLPPLMAFTSLYPPCESCMKALKNQLEMIDKNTRTDH